jgi:rhodanese-related sulfurtransferase
MKIFAPLFLSAALFAPAFLLTASAQTAVDISVEEVAALVTEHADLLILDVRTSGEWDGGHMEDAAWIDFLEDDFSTEASRIAKDRPLLIYCAAGGRSANAMKALARSGFTHLYNLEGVFYAWQDAGKVVSNSKPVKIR